MKKTGKKREQDIVRVLTQVCDDALKSIEGFEWLTHTVNYKRFPQSLKVIIVFNDKSLQLKAIESGNAATITTKVITALSSIKVDIQAKQVSLDNEEDCATQHQGNWQSRLQTQ